MSSHAGKHGTLTTPSARAQRRTAAREEAAEKKKQADKKKRVERAAAERKLLAPPAPFVYQAPPAAAGFLSSGVTRLPHVEPIAQATDPHHWTNAFGHAIIEKQSLFVADQCIDASRHCRVCNRMYPCQADDERERRNRVRDGVSADLTVCSVCAEQTEFQYQQPMRAVFDHINSGIYELRSVADTRAQWREKD
jgi:hypothetical protein